MKWIVFAGIILSFASCNNDGTKETAKIDTSKSNTSGIAVAKEDVVSIDELLSGYLDLKNALVDDNGKAAANAAKKMNAAVHKLEELSMTGEQKKVYADVKEDIEEHTEHIADNAGKIEHQREHFDWLSNAMYELVKTFKPAKTLYKDRCLMFNESKGAIWLSEIKEIKNPYYGKKMLTCGVIKEEIK